MFFIHYGGKNRFRYAGLWTEIESRKLSLSVYRKAKSI
jgi:hypothetical protein